MQKRVVNLTPSNDDQTDNQGIVAKVSEATEVVAEASDLVASVVTTAASDIGSYIRSQREAAQVSMRQLASRAGVSNPYLSQIERGLRKPSADVLAQIAKGLRVSSEVLYVRAGFLEERPHGPGRDTLLGDTAPRYSPASVGPLSVSSFSAGATRAACASSS